MIKCGAGTDACSVFSFTVNLIVNSVPLSLFSSSSPSNWSTREVTSCMPRVSSSSISRFLGMPTPSSETVRIKLVLLQPSTLYYPFPSLRSLILISPLFLPGNACLREFETSSLTIIPKGTAISILNSEFSSRSIFRWIFLLLSL